MKKISESPHLEFVIPTKLIESQHQAVVRKAAELTDGIITAEDRARNIFYFIRDEIRYEFRAKFDEQKYLASYILQDGKGFCSQKAILFCALARSCGIPAGIYFYDIIDHSLPGQFVSIMKTRILFHHAIAALHLNGAWHKYDATLDIQLTEKNDLHPVEFSPDRDCLMRERTRSGSKHIEYIKEHGLYPDVSFGEIINWFREGYPHLVERYGQSLMQKGNGSSDF